jgi:hypothetical protein
MNEQFPIVKSLDSLYDALYMAVRGHQAQRQAKNFFPTKIYFAFFSVAT